jgi:Big-like domain-containing protein
MKLALVLCAAVLAVFAPAALAAPPEITLTGPPAVTSESSATFTFSATPATATFTCSLDSAAPVACDSPETYPDLARGPHTFVLTATDGTDTATAPAYTFAIGPPAPVVTVTSPSRSPVALTGTAEAGGTVTIAGGSGDPVTATVAGDGTWTAAVSAADGSHDFTATVKDAAGNVSPATVKTVDVDTTAPAAPVITGGPDAFGIAAEAGAALACRLDGPGGGGTFAACASGIGYPGLAPGDYLFLAQATDAAGNVSAAAEHPFSVAAIPAATPTPTPTATPAPRPTPVPVATPSFRQSVVLRPATGRTLIRRPGTTAFEELRSKTSVPLGTAVNVKDGTVVLTSAPAAGAKTETAKLLGGVFTVTQPATGIELALSESLRCGHSRQLTADGAGTFRIRGRFGTATGRGAKWQVQDSCSSTTVRVTRGVVAVLGKRAKKTVLVRAGRHYTAQSNR